MEAKKIENKYRLLAGDRFTHKHPFIKYYDLFLRKEVGDNVLYSSFMGHDPVKVGVCYIDDDIINFDSSFLGYSPGLRRTLKIKDLIFKQTA